MKKPILPPIYRYSPYLCLLVIRMLLVDQPAAAQVCPMNGTTSISSYPNTYYPATSSVAAGSKSIVLGAVTYGTTQIKTGDILLVIQMQGVQFSSNNSANYGSGLGTGSGYYANASLLAGAMEYVVADGNVPLTGGTLNITTGLVNSYQSSTPAGNNGQYTFQVIRVPVYFDLQLTGTITAPRWDGVEGGVVVLFATDDINLNAQTIDASGLGFRGGGGRSLTGAGVGSKTDYATQSTRNANGSKGEGIAGTPKYTNDNNSFLDIASTEGFSIGSYARGAPGNAGGGATDGNPANANDQNTGGGGGGNGGAGGNGGNSWSTNIACGGKPGATFAQASASRLVMGGGGGAGTSNNATGTPGNGFASSGSAGGGIIIVIAQNSITGTGTILANGSDGNSTVQNDGGGGAGAGGSILIYNGSGNSSNITVQANGGAGGSNEESGGPSHGPGGGGGGGIIYSNATLNAASSVTGGIAGTTAGETTNYGATNGSAGSMVTNMNASAMAQVPTNCTVLATSFIDVKAVAGGDAVNIGWEVARKSNTIGYVVERSTDGSTFTAIGSVPFNNNGGTDDNYQYADHTAYTIGGILYYRIRETQIGGQDDYSKVVTVQLGASGGKLSVYPNPARNVLTVSFTMTAPQAVSLRLFDEKGAQLWEQQYQAGAGQNTIQIDRIAALPEGIYLLHWFDGLTPRMVKVFVQH